VKDGPLQIALIPTAPVQTAPVPTTPKQTTPIRTKFTPPKPSVSDPDSDDSDDASPNNRKGSYSPDEWEKLEADSEQDISPLATPTAAAEKDGEK
jgi:hypothetical protein